MPITLNDLFVPSSGQFFGIAGPLDAQTVTNLFDGLLQGVPGQVQAREERAQGAAFNTNYWASFLCFPRESEPSFLRNTTLRQTTYSFLLIVEIQKAQKWYLGIFKSGIGALNETFQDLCVPLPRKALMRAFGRSAKYGKLSSRRMTVSNTELIGTSYEADDLELSMPTLAVPRSIPRLVKLRSTKHGTVSITPNTSRVYKADGRGGVEKLVSLLCYVATEVQQTRPNRFVDHFPVAIPFQQKPKSVKPSGLVFDWPRLIANEELALTRTDPNSNLLAAYSAEQLLADLGGMLHVRKDGTEWSLQNAAGAKVGRLRSNTRSYSVYELAGNTISVSNNETQETDRLITWVRENNAFSIAMSEPDYFYTGGHLFKRSNFDQEVELVAAILSPVPALGNVNSEKGNPVPSTPAETQFPQHSIFRVVEDVLFPQRDYLWCTDLGTEWADYIALYGSRLVLMHCKHGGPTLGATPYQEVVGQALKNLSRVQPNVDAYTARIKTAAQKNTWGHTGIIRLRDVGKTWVQFETAAIQFMRNPGITREVHLVLSMLSRAAFAAEASKPKKAAEFIQLVWLLASFMNSAREVGARPLIVCAP